MIKPYTRITIKFISGELNIDPHDVESLLVSCILDDTITGRIDQVRTVFDDYKSDDDDDDNNIDDDDQVTGVLELDKGREGTSRYQALDKWNNQLNNLQKLVINKMA